MGMLVVIVVQVAARTGWVSAGGFRVTTDDGAAGEKNQTGLLPTDFPAGPGPSGNLDGVLRRLSIVVTSILEAAVTEHQTLFPTRSCTFFFLATDTLLWSLF
jgi:hypothetical protein